ncbi:hypothetical protein ACFXTI_036157 [Malus domestica]
MRCSCTGLAAILRRGPDVQVERVGPVKVEVGIDATNVSIPESQCLVGNDLEGGLGVLAEAKNGGSVLGERRGELDVLVLEDQEGVGV